MELDRFLGCKCGNKSITVAVSKDQELVFLCEDCKSIILVLDKWPDERVLETPCGMCEDCKCGTHTHSGTNKQSAKEPDKHLN